jgi:hypothetical protein
MQLDSNEADTFKSSSILINYNTEQDIYTQIIGLTPMAGNTNRRGRFITADHLRLYCNKVNNVCNIKSSGSKLVSTRRSTTLSLPVA